MIAKRYALILDRQGGRLDALAPIFRELGMGVTTVSRSLQGLEIVDNVPGICIAVVATDVGQSVAQSFIDSIRETRVNLPVLWVPDGTVTPTKLAHAEMLTGGAIMSAATRTQLRKAVHAGVYPKILLQDLVSSVNQVLTDCRRGPLASFNIVDVSKSTTTAELYAGVTFWSTTLTGRLAVGGRRQWLRNEQLGNGNFGEDAEWDFLGELANGFVGNFKKFFERRGADIHQEPPTKLTNKDATGYEQVAPLVNLRAQMDQDPANVLWLHLTLHGAVQELLQRPETPPDAKAPEAGEVTLL